MQERKLVLPFFGAGASPFFADLFSVLALLAADIAFLQNKLTVQL